MDEPAAKRQKLDIDTSTPTQSINTTSSYFPSLQNAFQSGYPPGFSFGQQQFDQQQNSTDGTKTKQNAGEQTLAPGDKSSAEERLQKFMELLAEKEVCNYWLSFNLFIYVLLIIY